MPIIQSYNCFCRNCNFCESRIIGDRYNVLAYKCSNCGEQMTVDQKKAPFYHASKWIIGVGIIGSFLFSASLPVWLLLWICCRIASKLRGERIYSTPKPFQEQAKTSRFYELQKLIEMKEKSLLTDDEFSRLKEKLLKTNKPLYF